MAETISNPLLDKYFNKSSFNDLLNVEASKNSKEVKNNILSIENLIKAKTNTSTKLTYNQLRNIYQIVKDEAFETDVLGFMLTLPKLAYIEARQTGEGKELVNFIRELATSVNSPEEYKVFIDLMTALVAYHKLHVKS